MTADLLAPLERRLAALRGDDLLVFHRVGAQRWAHLGGLGRGRGWAGIIELDAAGVPELAEREVLPVSFSAPRQVVGPYHALDAVLVRPTHDRLVVVGSRLGRLAPDGDWAAIADAAAALVGDVSAEKRLADELEVLQAVQGVAAIDTGAPLETVLAAVAGGFADALSCEISVVHLPDAASTHVRAPDGLARAVAAAAQQLAAEGRTRCAQEAVDEPLPGVAAGVRSWLLLPLPGHPGAGVLVAHTDAAPRGFTTLCRQLGDRLAEAAALVVTTARSRHRAAADAELFRRWAERDQLTGLVNRTGWERLLAEGQDAIAGGESCGVLVLDVDGLKDVNDRYGHDAGDTMLRAFASLLEQTCPADAVARLGGDEFAVLVRSPHADLAVRERRDAIEAALASSRGPLRLLASIGCCSTGPLEDLRACVRRADQQMYAAKQCSGRRRRQDDEPHDGELEHALHAVLTGGAGDHGAVSVALQPLVGLPGGELIGVEALARWTHPVLGPVSPAVFVPAAERLGLVGALDEHVLRLAAAEVMRLRRTHPALWLSCNVSAHGLGPELVDLVGEVLAASGLPAGALHVELTEVALGCPVEEAAVILGGVRALGVGVALDDLGADHSGLGRIATLPLTQVKIDRTVVAGAAQSPRARQVLEGLVVFMHGLGLSVCLEGVESPEEIAVARGSGADLAQGYAYGVPGCLQAVEVPTAVAV